MPSSPHRFLLRKVKPALNIEEAKTYIQRIRYLVLQFCVVLVILGVIGIIMIGATHDYDYTNASENKVFTIFYGIKTVSSIVSLLGCCV